MSPSHLPRESQLAVAIVVPYTKSSSVCLFRVEYSVSSSCSLTHRASGTPGSNLPNSLIRWNPQRRRQVSFLFPHKSAVRRTGHQGVWGSKWTEVTLVMGQQSQVEPHWEMAGCRGGGKKRGKRIWTWGQNKTMEAGRERTDTRGESGGGGRRGDRHRREKWQRLIGLKERKNKEEKVSVWSRFKAHLSERSEHFVLFPWTVHSGCLTLRQRVVMFEHNGLICSFNQDQRWESQIMRIHYHQALDRV